MLVPRNACGGGGIEDKLDVGVVHKRRRRRCRGERAVLEQAGDCVLLADACGEEDDLPRTNDAAEPHGDGVAGSAAGCGAEVLGEGFLGQANNAGARILCASRLVERYMAIRPYAEDLKIDRFMLVQQGLVSLCFFARGLGVSIWDVELLRWQIDMPDQLVLHELEDRRVLTAACEDVLIEVEGPCFAPRTSSGAIVVSQSFVDGFHRATGGQAEDAVRLLLKLPGDGFGDVLGSRFW